MISRIDSVVFLSENTQALADFYKDKVGLEIKEESEGEDGVKMF